MLHLTDTRLRTPCEMPYQRERVTVNHDVVGSSPSGGAIFVVRKSYKTQKAQDLVGLVLFCCLYIVLSEWSEIFEFRSCILTCFSKNRT